MKTPADEEFGLKEIEAEALTDQVEKDYHWYFSENPVAASVNTKKAAMVRELSFEGLLQAAEGDQQVKERPVGVYSTSRRVSIRTKEKAITSQDMPPFLLEPGSVLSLTHQPPCDHPT